MPLRSAASSGAHPTGLALSDAEGTLVAADQGFCDLVDLPLSGVLGASPPYPWWPECEAGWFHAQLGSRLRSAAGRGHFEGHWKRGDGTYVSVAGEVTALQTDQDSIGPMLITVTPTGAATEEDPCDRAAENRSVLEPWLDRLFEANLVGIIAGEGQEVLEANNAFLQMLGYTREEFERGGIDWTAITPPEWYDLDARAGEVMFRDGVSPTIQKEYFHKDGSRVGVQIAGAVVRQRPLQWVSVVQDRTAERDYIDAIRWAVTPPADLPDAPGLAVCAHHFPSEGPTGHISEAFTGDFYDFSPLLDGSGWALVLGDVAGHGHQAASLTALARYVIRGAALVDPRASRVLAVLDQAILDADVAPAYCTAVYAEVRQEHEEARVRLARGGHPPPLLVRSTGQVERIEPDGLPVGLWADQEPRQEERLTLRQGDVLVLYTDGLTDTRPGDRSLSVDALERIAGSVAGAPPQEVADRILAEIHQRLSLPLRDDIALVTVGLDPEYSPGPLRDEGP